MYAQMNLPNMKNITRLTSVLESDLTKKCLAFYYNMFGSYMNTLNVYLTENDLSKRVWYSYANEGNKVLN